MTQRSAAVGDVAVIAGLPAAVLSRCLVDWRRALPPRMAPQDVAAVEEAVSAIRESGAAYIGAVQAARLSPAGSGEGQGKRSGVESDPWITTAEAAALRGVTPRRVRQLANERRLESRMVGGHLYFRRGQVLRLRTTRARS